MLIRIILFALLITGCTPEKDYDTYLIKEGEHACKHPYKQYIGQDYLIRFNESAVYTPDKENDLNKLWGYNESISQHHHVNSARFAWRYTDQLEIHGYVYNQGERHTKYIASVDYDWHYYHIEETDSTYVFHLDENQITMKRTYNHQGPRYMLFPYFGGQQTAPHDIRIDFK